MSSPEMESFDMKERDIEDAFDPLRRRRGNQTKHQTIYGIWADSDEEREERGRRGFGRKTKDYSLPVEFISGGVKVGDKVSKEKEKEEDKSDWESEEEEEEKELILKPTKKKFGLKVTTRNDKNEMGTWEKHTKGIGAKLLGKMGYVPGKGIGKNLQGISTPVEAFQRKGRGAIGLYGTEKTERAEKDFPTRKDSEEEEEEDFNKKLQRWKKNGDNKNKNKNKKIRYFTADELINSKKAKNKFNEGRGVARENIDIVNTKIIDMTGKEQRVLSGYQALSQKMDKVDIEGEEGSTNGPKLFDLPELTHNLQLLVDMTEEAIIKNSKNLNYEEDTIVNLQFEYTRLDEISEKNLKNINKLEKVLNHIERFQNLCKTSTNSSSSSSSSSSFSSSSTLFSTINECSSLLKLFQKDFKEEFYLYDLTREVSESIKPLIKNYFSNWEPLNQSNHGIEIMNQLKSILNNDDYFQSTNQIGDQMTSYDVILWEIVIPRIRKAIEKWNIKEPSKMLELIDTWLPVLNSWMLNSLIDQLILPKLQAAISSWNPLTDHIPIHSWVHPWLFIMGEKLSSSYPTIRNKLGTALEKWHPSDPSAKLTIQPWISVFDRNHFDVFLVKFIVPKLFQCLQQMEISPNHQILDPWLWVTSWVDLIPPMHMVSIIRDSFFSRWLKVLSTWLSLPNANSKEIGEWYVGWKRRIPISLVNDPIIRDCLHEGLLLMNRNIKPSSTNQSINQSSIRDHMTNYINQEKRKFDEAPPPQMPFINRPPASLKDKLDQKCQENGTLFVPLSNRMHDGKQIYKLGKNLMIYFDRGLVFFHDNNVWRPSSSIDHILNKIS